MSYLTRAFDNEGGDPVVVIVAEGRHDVSRLVHLLTRRGNCEQMDLGAKIVRQVRRHNGGRDALRLLLRHGGCDFTQVDLDPQPVPGRETVTVDREWFDRAMEIGVPLDVRMP